MFEDKDEFPKDRDYIEDWRDGRIGDWVLADDGCIIQILRAGKMMRKKGHRKYLGTCTGTFLALKNTKMDRYKTPQQQKEKRKEQTKPNERERKKERNVWSILKVYL